MKYDVNDYHRVGVVFTGDYEECYQFIYKQSLDDFIYYSIQAENGFYPAENFVVVKYKKDNNDDSKAE